MVVACLRRFDRQERDEKALEALKLGVIVIQLASPTLDTQIVQDKFQQLEQRLNEYATGFKMMLLLRLKNSSRKNKVKRNACFAYC